MFNCKNGCQRKSITPRVCGYRKIRGFSYILRTRRKRNTYWLRGLRRTQGQRRIPILHQVARDALRCPFRFGPSVRMRHFRLYFFSLACLSRWRSRRPRVPWVAIVGLGERCYSRYQVPRQVGAHGGRERKKREGEISGGRRKARCSEPRGKLSTRVDENTRCTIKMKCLILFSQQASRPIHAGLSFFFSNTILIAHCSSLPIPFVYFIRRTSLSHELFYYSGFVNISFGIQTPFKRCFRSVLFSILYEILKK